MSRTTMPVAAKPVAVLSGTRRQSFDLMRAFYGIHVEKLKQEALRRMQLKTRGILPHPFSWARGLRSQ